MEQQLQFFASIRVQNHAEMPDDGVSAYHMKFKPGGKRRKMRSGWFLDQNRVKVTQSVLVEDVPRGLTAVLKERGLARTRFASAVQQQPTDDSGIVLRRACHANAA